MYKQHGPRQSEIQYAPLTAVDYTKGRIQKYISSPKRYVDRISFIIKVRLQWTYLFERDKYNGNYYGCI
jgi:hypothetical protein